MSEVTIVSLAWNEAEMTEQFLRRLKKYTDIPHKLVFTDNGSDEPMEDMIREFYPDATVIRYEENIGCPATRNPSMEHVDTDICFWLDNDTMVGPNWYKPILDTLSDDAVGISANTTNYVVKRPWQLPFPFKAVDGGNVDWFMGWCVGFKTKAYKPINDYGIPVNLDDVELALGVKENGYKAAVCDPVFAEHLGSKTGRGWEFDDQKVLSQFWDNWKDKTDILELW